MKYLHYFDNEDDFRDAYYGEDYDEPWVSLVEDDEVKHVDFNKSQEDMNFTFEILSDSNIVWKTNDVVYTVTLKYKINS